MLSAKPASSETVPSLPETIVLHIIHTTQPVSGYAIRKTFTEITSKRLSFGTLVPMLHRFEKSGLVIRTQASDTPSYSWFLTPEGLAQLQSRLSLLTNVLRLSTVRPDPARQYWTRSENHLVTVPQKFNW